MGSWSESCGFSGMEIGAGEVAYIMLVGAPKYRGEHGAFSRFEPKTTLIRGRYNDYGYLTIEDDQAVLDVFNDQAKLELTQGEDFSIDHTEGRLDVDRWWMHGRAFDFLPAIKQEFSYFGSRAGGRYKSVKVKNIGESTDMRLEEIRAAYHDGREEYATRMRAYEAHEDKADLIEAVSCLSRFSLREIFGYSEHGPEYILRFQEALKANVENIDGLIEAYRRNWLLAYGMGELRKKLVPSEHVGPQHAGEIASVQFARFLIKAQAERKRRWGD